MVSLTAKAVEEVKKIIAEQKVEPAFLRVGVKGGGCSGFSYSLDLTAEKAEFDEEWEQEGVKIICDGKSLLYLDGTSIDFKDELIGRGFVFNNPSAVSKCGCGSSFSV